MTEADWLHGGNLAQMLRFANDRLGARKARQAAVAWCRRVAELFRDARCRRAWETVRRCAGGDVDAHELDAARAHVVSFLDYDPVSYEVFVEAAHALYYALSADFSDPRTLLNAAEHAATARAHHAPGRAAARLFFRQDAWLAERAYQCDVLRDLAGNPFREVRIDPAWVAANDGAAVRLARVIDAERRWEDMPILADALEEAGCTSADVLAHCRGAGPHENGCWVLDLLLEDG
jgi:hypothetical protein